MIDLNQTELNFAIKAVISASNLAKNIQNNIENLSITKNDNSPVTVADFTIQALIANQLIDHFPKDTLVAEENSDYLKDEKNLTTLSQIITYLNPFISEISPEKIFNLINHGNQETSNRFWTLDPIDGTKGFLRKDQYAIALALIEKGQIKIGVLGCPNLSIPHLNLNEKGVILFAVKDQGCFIKSLSQNDTPQKIQVSSNCDPENIVLLRSKEAGHTNTGKTGNIIQTLNITANPILMDSQAKYAMLACGLGDVLIRFLSSKEPNYKEKIWDQAAGSIILEEAGGKITDLNGTPLNFSRSKTLEKNYGILASNSFLHSTLLNEIKKLI